MRRPSLESVLLMEHDDPIAEIMTRLESLIERVIDRKFAELDEKFDEKFDEITVANSQIHKLVNSRMTRMLELANELAEAEEQVSSNKAEKRGAAAERERAARAAQGDNG
jgi:hypothetical protein